MAKSVIYHSYGGTRTPSKVEIFYFALIQPKYLVI